MKKEILISLAAHLTIISALVLLSSPFGKAKVYPTIYQVSLISLPKIEAKVAEAKAEATASKLEFKEEKALPKQKNISKRYAKKDQVDSTKEEKPKTQEQAPSQQIEGLGQATFEGGRLESPYYAGIVFARIKSMWRNPVRTASLQATILFRIQKDGQVTDAAVEVPSGNVLYDQAALRAVLAADPLPPLPNHYVGNDLAVHLNFVGVP